MRRTPTQTTTTTPRPKKDGDRMSSVVERSIRYRVNVSTSVKGVKTWECTVDAEGLTMEETLAESDKLVAALDSKYPAPVEGK